MTDSPYRIAPPGFTDEQWETFERDGILFFEDALDTDAIDELSAAMDRVCQQSPKYQEGQTFGSENIVERDPAFTALIRELRTRKMLDHTIVICAGEFGRTPKINATSGRDHWPTGFSMALAGGGFRAGHIHGGTDPAGGKIDSMDKDAIRVADIHTTVQHALGIEYDKEMMTPIGRPMALSEGEVIKTLLKKF